MLLDRNYDKKKYILFFSLIALLFIFIPAIVFRLYYQNTIYSYESIGSIDNSYRYGIVFGAGTNRDGEPNGVLRDRLNSAAQLYSLEKVDKILLSGNNDPLQREVDAMREYLIVEKGVDKDDLLLDGYGYRTFDTCMRASQVYEISKAVLITSNYHLPRSQYLCETAGIENIGAAGSVDFYMGSTFYIGREVLATHKSLIDTLIVEPDYSMEEYE